MEDPLLDGYQAQQEKVDLVDLGVTEDVKFDPLIDGYAPGPPKPPRIVQEPVNLAPVIPVEPPAAPAVVPDPRQTLDTVPQVTPVAPPTLDAPPKIEPEPRDIDFMQGLEYGFRRTLRDTRNLVADYFETKGRDPEAIQRIRDSADEMDTAVKNMGFQPMSLDEVEDFGTFIEYAQSTISTSGGPMLLSLFTGGTASPLMLSGELNASLKEIKGLDPQERLRLAGIGGAIGGVLENLGLGIIMKGIPRELIGKIGAKGIVNMVARADRVAAGRIAKGLIEGGVGEALTETGQEGTFALIEQSAGKEFKPGEIRDRLVEAFAGGGTAGMSLRGGGQAAAEAVQLPVKISQDIQERNAIRELNDILDELQQASVEPVEQTLPQGFDEEATPPSVETQEVVPPAPERPEVQPPEVPLPDPDSVKPEAVEPEAKVKPLPVKEPTVEDFEKKKELASSQGFELNTTTKLLKDAQKKLQKFSDTNLKIKQFYQDPNNEDSYVVVNLEETIPDPDYPRGRKIDVGHFILKPNLQPFTRDGAFVDFDSFEDALEEAKRLSPKPSAPPVEPESVEPGPAATPSPSITLGQVAVFGSKAINRLLGISDGAEGRAQRDKFFNDYAKENNLDPELVKKLGRFIIEDREAGAGEKGYPYERSPKRVMDVEHYNNQLQRVLDGDEKLLNFFNIRDTKEDPVTQQLAPELLPDPTKTIASVPGSKPSNVKTPVGNTDLETELVVVDLKDLKQATGRLQIRDRSRQESRDEARRRAQELDVDQITENSRTSDTGAPIIAQDGTIISGNGRVLTMTEVYRQRQGLSRYPTQLKAYQEKLKQIFPDAANFEKPILVRRLTGKSAAGDPVTSQLLEQFADESNQPGTAKLGSQEQANLDAKVLDLPTLNLYTGGDFTLAKNSSFVNAFLNKIPASEKGNVYKDGELTVDGLRRIKSAILAKAYEDPETLGRMLESTDDNVKGLSNGLLDAAPAFAKLRLDPEIRDEVKGIASSLSEAIKTIGELRETGRTAAEYFDQVDFLREADPVRDLFIRSFHNEKLDRVKSQTYIKDLLRFLTEEANAERAGALPGLDSEVTAEEVLTKATKRAADAEKGRSKKGKKQGELLNEAGPISSDDTSGKQAQLRTRKRSRQGVLESKGVDDTATRPKDSRDLETESVVNPQDAEPTQSTRGTKAGELVEKLTLQRRESVFLDAFRDAGEDPNVIRNQSVRKQYQVLQKLLRNKFGFKFIQKSDINTWDAVNALLDAYRNLQSMTATLALPADAIGLDGSLGLALPGVDWGRYFAAYYPENALGIPVQTKSDLPPMEAPFIIMPKRPNSFAHEWGHALDFHLMKKFGGKEGRGLIQVIRNIPKDVAPWQMETPETVQEAMGNLINAMFFDQAEIATKIMAKEQLLVNQEAAYRKKLEKNPNLPEPKSIAKTREELKRLRQGSGRVEESQYRKDSTEFARRTASDKNYWREPTEMFARAFEAYVAHIVTKAGGSTEFISLPDDAYQLTLDEVKDYDIRLPLTHPQESERNVIFKAFSELFDAMRRESVFNGEPSKMPGMGDTIETGFEFFGPLQPVIFTKEAREEQRAQMQAGLTQEQREKQRPSRYNGRLTERFIDKAMDFIVSRPFLSKRATLEQLQRRYRKDPQAAALIGEILNLVATDPGGTRTTFSGGTFEEGARRENRRFATMYNAAMQGTFGPGAGPKFRDLTEEQQKDLRMFLTGQKSNVSKKIQKIGGDLRTVLNRVYEYARRSGIDVSYLQDGAYLPRMLDMPLVETDIQGFLSQAYNLYKDVIFINEFLFEDVSDYDQIQKLDQQLAKRKVVQRHFEGKDKLDLLKDFRKDAKKLRELKKKLDTAEDPDAIEAEMDEIYENMGEYYHDLYEEMGDTFSDLSSKDWHQRIMSAAGQDPAAHSAFNRFTKRRKLPSEADKYMNEFYLPVNEAIEAYIPQVVKKAEYEKRFGRSRLEKGTKKDPVTGKNRDYLDYILDDKMVGKVNPDDRLLIRQIVQFVTGTQAPVRDRDGQKILNTIHAYGTMALLGRAAWSSIAEPLTTATQTGRIRDGLKAFSGSLYEAYAKVNKDAAQKVALDKQLANILGVIDDPEYGDMVANRLGGSFADDPKLARRVNRFFSVIKLTGITAAQRRSVMKVGQQFFRELALEIKNPQGKDDAAKKKYKKRAEQIFNEFGVAAEDMEQFVEFLVPTIKNEKDLDKTSDYPFPSVDDLVEKDGSLSDMGEIYSVAIMRFIDQSIQDPKNVDRPMYAEHPLGRIVYGIQSFIYAFHRNVLTKAVRSFKRRKAEEGWKGGAQHIGAAMLGPFLTLYAGHTLVATVRAFLFDRDRLEDEAENDRLYEYIFEQGIYRAGLTGAVDPYIQTLRSIKYNRDINTILTGAGPSFILDAAQRAFMPFMRNAESTVAAEYQAVAGLYNLFVVPAVVLMASAPGFGKSLGPLMEFRGAIAGSLAAFGTSSGAKHFVARNIIKGLYGEEYYPGAGGRKKKQKAGDFTPITF
jgi:hypothetical protein